MNIGWFRTGVLAAGALAAAFSLAPSPAAAGEGTSRPLPAEDRAFRMVQGRAYLGVSTLDLTPELRAYFGAPKESGVLVSEVAPDSPASRAGLHVGDVITRVGADPVESFEDLTRSVGGSKKGDRVEVEIVRDRSSRRMTATLDERKGPFAMMREGPGKGRIVIREGDGPDRTIELRGPLLPRQSLDRLEHFFEGPEWRARLDDLDECQRVRERLGELEKRLRALEKKLPKR